MAGETDAKHYATWLRTQPCCAPGECLRNVELHHPRHMVGLGMRASDSSAIPLCPRHHQHLHRLSGPFRGWDKSRRKSWERERIEHHRSRYSEAA